MVLRWPVREKSPSADWQYWDNCSHKSFGKKSGIKSTKGSTHKSEVVGGVKGVGVESDVRGMVSIDVGCEHD